MDVARVAVDRTVAVRGRAVVDKRLYLPPEWTINPARCEGAGVPQEKQIYRSETELALEMLKQIGKLLERVGAGEITPGGGGSDIGPLLRDGVPGLGERTVGTHYFDWHHTEADTLDKVNPDDFRKNVAALAVMGYALADMPDRLTAAPGGSHHAERET